MQVGGELVLLEVQLFSALFFQRHFRLMYRYYHLLEVFLVADRAHGTEAGADIDFLFFGFLGGGCFGDLSEFGFPF